MANQFMAGSVTSGICLFISSGQNFFVGTWNSIFHGVSSDGSAISGLQNVAYGIIVTLAIVGIYSAWAKGNSIRDLISTLAWCVVCGAVVNQWTPVFSVISQDAFALVDKVNPQDFFTIYVKSTVQKSIVYLSTFRGVFLFLSFPALLQDVIALVIMLLYYLCYYFFILFFTGWGIILYGIGPLLIAMLPVPALRSLGAEYAKSVGEWALWPLLYALMANLALKVSNLIPDPKVSIVQSQTSILTQQFIAVGFMLCMMLIPLLAGKILRGDFAGTANQAISTMMTAARAASGLLGGLETAADLGGGGATAAGTPGGDGLSLGAPPATPQLGPGGGTSGAVGAPPATPQLGSGSGGDGSGRGGPSLGPGGGTLGGGLSAPSPSPLLLTDGSGGGEGSYSTPPDGSPSNGGPVLEGEYLDSPASTRAIVVL